MAEIINGARVLTDKEREILRHNLLHPNFENLNLIVKMYGKRAISVNDDGSWVVSVPNLNFDLTVQD